MGRSILPLDRSHDIKNFNCGTPALDDWLKKTAGQHINKGLSRTFVLVEDESPGIVIGYYALSMRGLILTETLPESMRKALPLKVPAMTLARLGVSLQEQGNGYGELLMVHAMGNAKVASDTIGGSFLFVDAKGADSAEYYQRYGFEALPDSPHTLCMAMATIRSLLDDSF